MAIQSFQLDPNAQSYTDDEIVGKINNASVAISRAASIDGAALSAVDSDDITQGSSNAYYPSADSTKLAGIEDSATADQSGDEIVSAINSGSSSISRESALSQDDLKIVKSNPTAGEFYVKNIHRQSDGKLDIEYDDTAV